MRQIKFALAFAAALLPGLAAAQTFPTVPDHTVIGRVGTGTSTGPSQAIPFATLFPQIQGIQSANTVMAGPTSGGAALAAFRALVGTDIPQINLATGSNGGVTGLLPNANLANPATTVNGQTCTLGASCTVFAGGWKVSNLSAANDGTNTSTQMDLSADWVSFYNPSTGVITTKGPLAGGGQIVSGLACNISSAGPVAGGRDQSAAFASTNTVWFYLIINGSGTISCETSLTAPTALNAGSTTGPVLPAGYTSYAPAFPILMTGSATLQPTLPQGGSTNFFVRGNHVFLSNTPFIGAVGGATTATVDFTPWVPAAYQTVDIYADLEMTFAATGIGGAILGTVAGNFWNASLYCTVSAQPCAMDGVIPGVYLPTLQFTYTFSHSSGTISTVSHFLGPVGYTFPQ